MRRSQAANLVKLEHAEIKAGPAGPAVNADISSVEAEAEATLDALTGLAAETKGLQAIDSSPFEGFARPQPHECMVK